MEKRIYNLVLFSVIVVLVLTPFYRRWVISSHWAYAAAPLTPNESAEENTLDAADQNTAPVGPGVYQDNSTQVKYKGVWVRNQPGGSGGTFALSNALGSSVRLKLTGANTVKVTLRRAPNIGKAQIIIKQIGGAVVVNETKDLYKAGAALFATFTYPGLVPANVYRVRIVDTGTKNTAASNSHVGIDKLEIVGSVVPTSTPTPTEDPNDDGISDAEEEADEVFFDTEDAGIDAFVASSGDTIIEENDAHVKYKGTWTAGSDGSTTYKRANVVKDNARIKFKAASVKVILRKSSDAGRARVILRNLTTKTYIRKRINLYSATPSYTTDEIIFDNLDNDVVYRVRVYVIGRHSSLSTGDFVGLDKFIFTGHVVLPSNGPSSTPSPTGTGTNDEIKIPIGTKDTLTFTIGSDNGGTPTVSPSVSPSVTPTGGTPTVSPSVTPTGGPPNISVPNITFKVKFYGISAPSSSELKVRLKAVDMAVAAESGATAGSCQEPGTGEFFYKDVVLSVDSSGVYSPKPGTTFTAVPGHADLNLAVAEGGWIPLGLPKGKTYSVFVKGPKHVNAQMVSNVVLNNGIPDGQKYDWSSNLLYAGDVPDPDDNSLQDCVVNAGDISLVKSRIISGSGGNASASDLNVADLDYNGVLNSRDMSQLTTTLSTRPDDD